MDRLRALSPALYTLAALLVVVPLADLGVNLWPYAPGDVQWRYGTVGLLSGFLLTPILGLTLAIGVALALRQSRVAKLVALLDVFSGLLLVVITAWFVLDSLELRVGTPPEGRGLFDIGVVKAVFKNLAGAAALIMLGIAGYRSARHVKPAPSEHDEGAPIVVR